MNRNTDHDIDITTLVIARVEFNPPLYEGTKGHDTFAGYAAEMFRSGLLAWDSAVDRRFLSDELDLEKLDQHMEKWARV